MRVSLGSFGWVILMNALVIFLPGCSSAPQKGFQVDSLIPSTLAVRRPVGMPADPSGGPGGADYKSDPLPNAQFDCESAAHWLRDLPLDSIRSCFATIGTAVKVSYRLVRDAQPRLELQDPEDAPECLRTALPKIPVPREIFFQSWETTKSLACYSRRLDIEEDREMGIRLPIHKWALGITFPLEGGVPDSSEAVSRLLTGWALTPLWVKEGGAARVNWVPESLCRQCLGNEHFLTAPPMGPEWTPRWPN